MSAHRTLHTLPFAVLMALTIAACGADDAAPPNDADSTPSLSDADTPSDAGGATSDTAPDEPGEDAESAPADTNAGAADSAAPSGDSETPASDADEPQGDVTEAPEEDTDAGEEGCQVNADCEDLAADMPCHVSVCEFGECLTVQLSDNIACDDGNPCTMDDLCTAGVCDGLEDLSASGCASVTACDDAVPITALPFTSASTTIGGAGYYAAADCPGSGDGKGAASNDALYRFAPTESGTFTVALTDLSDDPEGLDAVLYLVQGCPALATSSCLGAQDIWYKHGREEITVALTADVAIFIVVDGYSSSENIEGNFELVVTQQQAPEPDCGDGLDDDGDGATDCADPGCVETEGCLALLPGALCTHPILIEALPFLHAGTTEDMGNEASVEEESCPNGPEADDTLEAFGEASDDVFFAFTPSTDGTFLISLDKEGSADNFEDLVMSVYEGGCPTGLETDLCVAGDNATSDGGELLVLELIGGTPYVIVLDGWDNDFDINGGYTLRVDEMANVPVGALAITEVMGNPEGDISDGSAEWLEVRNTTDIAQSLKGLGLTYRSWNNGASMPLEPSNIFIIEDDISIDPGATAIIAKSVDNAVNGGLNAIAAYGAIALTNNGAKSIALQLVKAGWNGEGEPPEALVIDNLTLPAGTFSGAGKAASFQLDEARASNPEAAAMNDWAYRWCHTPSASATPYFGANYGSPGLPNGLCEGADGPPPMTYEEDILPIFAIRCIGCHTGNGCSGGGCWDNYDDLMLDSYYCVGKTKGECTSVRIHNGSMPQGSGCSGDPVADEEKQGCLTSDEQQYIDWWIEGGMTL